MSKVHFLLSLTLLLTGRLLAHSQDSLKVAFNGYCDFYYAFDFNKPAGLLRHPFLVSYNRHRIMGLNLACAGFEIGRNKWRTKATLQGGTFSADNYETATDRKFRFIQEAYAGMVMNRKKSIWLDVGVFPSHIGYEAAIGADNFAAGRSLASELTPYFVSGAKISFNYRKIQFSGLLLNGWNRIFSFHRRQYPTLGSQLNFSFNKNCTLHWNTMLGSASQIAFNNLRLYNNIFINWAVNEKSELIVSFDLGLQNTTPVQSIYKSWSTASLVFRRHLARNLYLTFRGEYFRDKSELVTKSSNGNFFNILGCSSNVDYRFSKDALIRLEGRVFHSALPYFYSESQFVRRNSALMICFSKKF